MGEISRRESVAVGNIRESVAVGNITKTKHKTIKIKHTRHIMP